MLNSLSIRDIVLIDRLDLTFHPGLGVLTGETGAGKSILLDALGLALGGRSDAGLIRRHADRATVTAAFDVPEDHPTRARLAEHGIDASEGLVLRRVVTPDGRTRAFVNDQPTSVALLRELGEELVEIQGHFEAQGLLNPQRHRAVLDAFGGLDDLVRRTRDAHRDWRAAIESLEALEAEQAHAQADEEFLRHALDELARLDPQDGEESALAERRTTLLNAEKIVEALNGAHDELTGGRGAEDTVRSAQRMLDKVEDSAGALVKPVMEGLDRAAAELEEAARQLRSLASEVEASPAELRELEDRLFALRDLARKHRIEPDALPAFKVEIESRLAAIDDRGGELARRRQAVDDTRAAYVALAEELSGNRKAAAAKLDEAVMAELAPLKLEKATFATRVDPLPEDQWGAEGMDRVAFEVATNPGTTPGPITKIASAGELSRFMLALKVVLASVSTVPTLVFDEVDSGIGGATAAAVGERLARLGRDLQVLVVTHSPQVAARGAHHWRVQKGDDGDGAITHVEELPEGDRREEIARMISGRHVTDEARAAADSLIAGHPA